MATFKSFYDKYKLSMSKNCWDFLSYCLSRFMQPLNYSGVGTSPNELKIDEILCPQLIFEGFVLMTAKGLHFEERYCDEYGQLRKDAHPSDQEEKLFDVLSDCFLTIDDELRTRLYDMLFNIFGGEILSDNEGTPVFNSDMFFVLHDELMAYVDWKLTTGKDSEFIDVLYAFLDEPFTIKERTVISVNSLLSFTMNYFISQYREKGSSDPRDSFADLTRYYMDLRALITSEVVCQDNAVRRFLQGLFNGSLRESQNADGPKATFLFVGPPGVGKTYLAKVAAKHLKKPYKVFNMSEYADHESFHGLIGFEPTFKAAQAGDLTSYVSANSNAVLVFDEIEKAHVNTIRLFLSILEGGMLRDLFTQEDVDFSDTIVIFTSNAGRKFYEQNRGIVLSSLPENTLIDALGDERYNETGARIPTEILSRMSKGNVIGFDHMNPIKLIPIIKAGLEEGARALDEKLGINYSFDETMLPYIFLFHMGAKLDARVASARSKSFITDSIYQISERASDDKSDLKLLEANSENLQVNLSVQDEDLAKELTVPDRRTNLLIVCMQSDYNNFAEKQTSFYKLYHVYAEKDNEDFKEYISQQMKDHEIDAILIDPFMRSENGSENLRGINHMETRGLDVLDWVTDQDDMPPVYCMELKRGKKVHTIGFTDQLELTERGVRGFLHFSEAANKDGRTKILEDLAYELFLSRKLDSVISKGKTLDYSMSHVIKKNDDGGVTVELKLSDLELIRSMDAEAQEIFIDDDARKEGGFDSIIGADAAIEELRSFVHFIKEPKAYRKSGRMISKGLLMYGPPGTGKTMLARALACEADCPFISVSGSQLANGSEDVGKLFSLARKYAPSVVFIDEIEAIAQQMGNPVLKSLLIEMDGFSGRDKPVFVIAATNAGEAPDLGQENIYLDPALLRRFTRKVYMKIPDKKARIKFTEKKKEKLRGKDYNLDSLTKKDIEAFANISTGRSLAEIDNVFSIAISRAAENSQPLTIDLLTNCFEETIYGEEHKYAPDHLRITALHEAGHAFMGFVCSEGKNIRFEPEYATIIARGGYLGMVQRKNDETMSGYSKAELIKLIRISLAGRATETVFEKEDGGGLTTGASNDLEHATYLAQGILSRFGMEEGFLPTISPEKMLQSPLAEKYYDKLGEILSREMAATVDIIKKNKKSVEKLADALLDKSRLDSHEMKQILGIKE